MIKAVGWFPVYHWPIECLEFIKEARAEVRSMGFSENSHYVKIRPEWREGRMELKAEVKESRVGAREVQDSRGLGHPPCGQEHVDK